MQVVRGQAGGCRLAADLTQLTLYDLILATGERSDLSACMDPGYICAWREEHGGCTVYCCLAKIQHKLEAELKSYSLWDILAGQC